MAKFTVQLVGGLGNQLHCYAFGKALQIHQNVVVHFDCDSSYWSDPYGRIYLLDNFPSIEITRRKMPQTFFMRLLSKIFLKSTRILSQLLPLFFKPIVTEPLPHHFCAKVLSQRYFFNPYFSGYWASYKYCNGIEQSLRAELRPPQPSDPVVIAWSQKLKEQRSCFIHYRSYNELKNTNDLLLIDYYKKAIDLLAERVPGVNFFVFSDDYSCAQSVFSQINFHFEFIKLEHSKGNLESLNDFYLMYCCNHAIIGNSTFSWWAAWLSDNKDKIIIAPRGYSPWGNDWVPNNWIYLK